MFEQLKQDLNDLACETTARSWILQIKALREVFEMNPSLQEITNHGLTTYTRKGGGRMWVDDCHPRHVPNGLVDFDKATECADYVCNSGIEGIWTRGEDWMQSPERFVYESYNFRVLADENHLGAGIKAGMVFRCVGYGPAPYNTVTLEYREGCHLSIPLDKVQITDAQWAYADAAPD